MESEYNYNAPPYLKKRMWAEIVEAAKVVIAKGGGNIRFVPDVENSERLYRETHNAKEK